MFDQEGNRAASLIWLDRIATEHGFWMDGNGNEVDEKDAVGMERTLTGVKAWRSSSSTVMARQMVRARRRHHLPAG